MYELAQHTTTYLTAFQKLKIGLTFNVSLPPQYISSLSRGIENSWHYRHSPNSKGFPLLSLPVIQNINSSYSLSFSGCYSLKEPVLSMKLYSPINKLALVALLAIVFSGLLFLALKAGIGNYALDDAYIVEHSVKGILANHESRFMGSTPWEGVTSPVYVGVITIVSLLIPIQFSHWIVSALSTLLMVSGWYLICRRNSLNNTLAMAVAIISLLAGFTYYQLTNGLETGMAMAALTWTLLALDYDRPPNWSYALVGIQCFIRPELLALSAIFVIYIVAKRPRGWLRGVLITACFFAISALLLFLASGTVIPNTLSAKTYFFAEGCGPDAFKSAFVLSALWMFINGLGLFAAGFVMAAISRQRLVLFSFIAIFIFAYFQKFPGALFHNYSRYLYLVLPIAVFGWAACLGHANKVIRFGSTALGAIVAVSVIYSLNASFQFYVDDIHRISTDNTQMAQWVAQNVPKDAVIVVHDAGKISTLGEQPLIDLVGLKSSFSMEVHRHTTFAECRRIPTAISEIARHAKASYMVVTADWDGIFGLTESLKLTGWTVERADKERGDSHYRVYRIFNNAEQPIPQT